MTDQKPRKRPREPLSNTSQPLHPMYSFNIKGNPRVVFLGKGTGVAPVSEAARIAIGTTTAGDDEREEDDADNDDDLDRGQPELELAEELDATEVVDAEDDDDEDGLSLSVVCSGENVH